MLETIKNRRSNAYVLDKPLESKDLEQIIEAACWAPTHHKTQPWKFVVYEAEGRKKLTDLYVAAVEKQKDRLDAQTYTQRLEKAKGAAYRAPVVIAVSCLVGRSELKNPPAWEDEAATAAAIQNMLLTAESLGIASYWRTGWFTELEDVRKAYGLEASDRIMGYIYLGYKDPDKPEPIRPTPKVSEKVEYVK